MRNIYLFIHTFKYIYSTARSDHLVDQYKEQLVFCCAAPFFMKFFFHRCSLQICWQESVGHIYSRISHSSHIVRSVM